MPESAILRHVFVGEEQSDIDVPLESIIKDGVLDLYQDVLARNLFRVHLRGNRLVFQAGGFVGWFPINDSIAVEIRARVPLANLERILLSASGYLPEYLPARLKGFDAGATPTPSLLDLLSTRLLSTIEDVRLEGLHYNYQHQPFEGANPRGRIFPFASSLRQMKHNQPVVVSKAFTRSQDTNLNRCLRLALQRLLTIYRGMRDRQGAKAMAGRLALADYHFQYVTIDYSQRFLDDVSLHDFTRLPGSKLAYRFAVPIAKLVLSSSGVAVQSEGELILPSILIGMERVFESYLRAILARLRHLSPEISVLDGNQLPPEGAARSLFENVGQGFKAGRATPDVVIKNRGETALVIDAKYRPARSEPDRSDVEQVLTYSLVYRCERVALAYPRPSHTGVVTERVGTVGGIELYRIFVNLDSNDLEAEEKQLVRGVFDLLR